ncbi:hypothetical protein D0T87_00660 [Bacteroides sp. 51]|nr:hypothetical protein [Bacteroides sp. 51]
MNKQDGKVYNGVERKETGNRLTVGAVREPPNAQNTQEAIFGRFANRPYSKSFTSKPYRNE